MAYFFLGYKVGRVDQAETALGAEMRLAANKTAEKPKKEAGDKIVRRYSGQLCRLIAHHLMNWLQGTE